MRKVVACMKTLYYGGDIILDNTHKKFDSVLIDDKKIISIGNKNEFNLDQSTNKINLNGKCLMASFIDSHSHFSGCAIATMQCSVFDARSFDEILKIIKNYIKTQNIKPGEWVMVRDFDSSRLKENSIPDKDILDKASINHPIVLQHSSGHVGVFNSLGLKRLNINQNVQDPPNGKYERIDGKLTGYMEEQAFIDNLKSIPSPSDNELYAAYDKAQKNYASYGITTIQEGFMTKEMISSYKYLCNNNRLYLDVVAYMDFKDSEEILSNFKDNIKTYKNQFKLGGYKIFLDGSPQSCTAWMKYPYLNSNNYGTKYLNDEELEQYITTSFNTNFQLLAHCNGDAAIEQYIRVFDKLSKKRNISLARPVMIHSQFLNKKQIPKIKLLGIIPSFFIAHIYYWGDVHIKNCGFERAAFISPANSTQKYSIPYTLHQDSPVIKPDMFETIWCAINRITQHNQLLQKEECISVYDAIKAVTINAAYQYFEENSKGSIKPGKNADFIILNKNPYKTKNDEIKNIKVLETIKNGKSIYKI